MSEEKPVEVEVELWNLYEHSFLIPENSNPQLEEIYKKQMIMPILILRRQDESVQVLRKIRLKSRHSFSTTSEAESAFGKLTCFWTKFFWENV
jgi:hypothetical protein